MHNTDWEKVNSLMLSAFQHYDEIEPKNTRETRSELLSKLKDMRVPLSAHLINAICNDPIFFDALLWGADFMSMPLSAYCVAHGTACLRPPRAVSNILWHSYTNE